MTSRKHIAHLWYNLNKQGLSYEEIAARYNVTKSTVAGAVFRHVRRDKYEQEKERRKVNRKISNRQKAIAKTMSEIARIKSRAEFGYPEEQSRCAYLQKRLDEILLLTDKKYEEKYGTNS